MSETESGHVDSEAFTVNFPFFGAPMTIRTKSDEIFIVMRFRIRPRDNVMNIDLDVSAGGDGTSVSGLNKDVPFSERWDGGAIFHPFSIADSQSDEES